jgi:hypothetical protein
MTVQFSRTAFRTTFAFALAALLLLPLAGCGGEPTPPAAEGGAAGGGETMPPISARDGEAATGGDAAMAGADSLAWELPTGWEAQTPSSAMRMAQASIPGEAGAAELAVFHFGVGGGGDAESNIQRWIGQMEVDPGTEPQRESFSVEPYQVTLVDVEGTLKPSMMGTGPSTAQPNSRLLGAVVEGPGGPWFFKATGPSQTLAAAKDDFRAMLQGLHPKA